MARRWDARCPSYFLTGPKVGRLEGPGFFLSLGIKPGIVDEEKESREVCISGQPVKLRLVLNYGKVGYEFPCRSENSGFYACPT